MNNPKTIEAIKEAVVKVAERINEARVSLRMGGVSDDTLQGIELDTYRLCDSLNTLQEPISGEHPLHAGDDADKGRGLYGKYRVDRIDGRPHKGEIFVLCNADKHALPALTAYAESCETEYPLLAADLRNLVENAPPAPVKEPELDEFEKWLVEGEWGTIEHVLEKYREIKQQQGAH